MSFAVNPAVADVTVVDPFATTPSLTKRAGWYSTIACTVAEMSLASVAVDVTRRRVCAGDARSIDDETAGTRRRLHLDARGDDATEHLGVRRVGDVAEPDLGLRHVDQAVDDEVVVRAGFRAQDRLAAGDDVRARRITRCGAGHRHDAHLCVPWSRRKISSVPCVPTSIRAPFPRNQLLP